MKQSFGGIDNPFENRWLYHDEGDKRIFHADALIRLSQDSFTDSVLHGVLDFDTVYHWGKLVQTGYRVLLNPGKISIVTGGNVIRFKNAMRIEDITIEFPNEKISLISYIGAKENTLRTQEMIKYVMGLRKKSKKIDKLHSYEVSQLLSTTYKSDNHWGIVAGRKDIFESNEMLDQLLISVLLMHARWGKDGHQRAIGILTVLLDDLIEKNVQLQFRGYPEDEVLLLIDEAKLLARNIIKDDEGLTRKNDRYIPGGNSSLSFFIAAPLVSKGSGKKRYVSKIQEHLEDRREKLDKNKEIKNESDFGDTEDDVLDRGIFEKHQETIQSERITKTDLDMILQKLSVDDARLISMYVGGFTHDQIGQEFSIQGPAVLKRLKKIGIKIKKYME